MAAPAAAAHLPNLFSAAVGWHAALEAGDRAARLAAAPPIAADLGDERRTLKHQRLDMADELRRLAHLYAITPAPQLPAGPVTERMLGLPTDTHACLFELDDVLTDSGVVHAVAWSDVLDDVLLRLTEKTGWRFVPFDPDGDYHTYLEGRLRLDGIHAFLAGRGIQLPEGRPDGDVADDTAFALARRKASALQRTMHRHGISARLGALRYLEAAGYAGIARAVLSASESTVAMLEVADLSEVVDAVVDANVVQRESLRPAPAPDVVLAGCRLLGADPCQTVVFASTPAAVLAARAAGATAIGVGAPRDHDLLTGCGAARAVNDLSALLERHLLAPRG